MSACDDALPIDVALPRLTAALRASNAAVLVAPPGAGKTTRVPLVLAQEEWARDRKIIVLEPRRLAARAAAARMAATLGEEVGATVGLRVRFGSKISRLTRIEIVTEGVFTRLLLDDPELSGIAAILFDEFHERSLDADLGLALARDVQQGLREDLKILVMSATIDAARVAAILGDAPVVESKGRAFPVVTHYLGRDPRAPIERQAADAVIRALRAEPGSILVFLPGAGEIRRVEALLKERGLDPSTDVVALHGTLDAPTQDRAIAPASAGRRKVVLATSIAETSLTIEGVRMVVDSGLARVPVYEPDVGLTRLKTVRVSRAAADQRRGRAGRTETGVCYRLWDEPETASLEPFAKPEILAADLSGFVLDLAQWGIADPARLTFLDPPPRAALAEARALLEELRAIDADGRLTEEGRRLRALPLPPRLARMIVDAAREGYGALAADIAVILTERGLGGDDIDLAHRLDHLRRDRSRRAEDARQMAKRWARQAERDLPMSRTPGEAPAIGVILALAYPDRIARNRGGEGGGFLLANGRGAMIDSASALARETYLAVAALVGTAAQSRIVLAASIALADIEAHFRARIEFRDDVIFDPVTASLRGCRSRRLGAIALSEQAVPVNPGPDNGRGLVAGVIGLGLDRLPWTRSLSQWRHRVLFLRRAEGEPWPDLSDGSLAARAEEWLMSLCADKTALADMAAEELAAAITALLPWNLRHRLDAEAPTHFEAPTGSRVPIDYQGDEGPRVAIRLQELFGIDRHPAVAGGRVPLIIELLSPAQRPVQVTRDLPGFWRGSYAAVKSEMRGRYPRHPWPDDPISAAATRRAKPRSR